MSKAIDESVRALPAPPARFAIIDRALTTRINDNTQPPQPVRNAWRLINIAGGRAPVSMIAHEVGWSERQLAKRFRDEIGVSPKQASRIVRFDRARRALQSGPDQSIARAAAEAGYAEQSHLNRDFNQFAGLPPSGWLHEEFRNVQAGPADAT